jgi:hypothetical protein
MRVWTHTLSGRISRKSSSFLENMVEEDNQSLHNENYRDRTLRDHMNPTRTSAPSCIVFPPDASHFNLKKFFPSHRTNSFKRQITTFTQKPEETFYQCWDMYKDLLNTCPHHGFETWRLVSYFYEGLTPKDRQMVELMCNGTFEDIDPDEAMKYLDLLTKNAQN